VGQTSDPPFVETNCMTIRSSAIIYDPPPQRALVPYVCPVCAGKGQVDIGFYRQNASGQWTSSSTGLEQCRSCLGKGIVWG